MPKFAIQPVDKQGEIIARAKTTVIADTPASPNVRQKVLAAVKRAGVRCERVLIAGIDAPELRLVWDRDGSPITVQGVESKTLEKKLRSTTMTRKSGPNAECRKAQVRAMYQNGDAQEDVWTFAERLGIRPASFKTWWSEFRRLGWPRKGEKAGAK